MGHRGRWGAKGSGAHVGPCNAGKSGGYEDLPCLTGK